MDEGRPTAASRDILAPERLQSGTDLAIVKATCASLFHEFGAAESAMLLSRDQLHLMISTVFHRVGISLEQSFTIAESELALHAFDIRGHGAVAESDFSAWILRGLCRSQQERQGFARASPLSKKMDRLLNAIYTLVTESKRASLAPSTSRVKVRKKKVRRKKAKTLQPSHKSDLVGAFNHATLRDGSPRRQPRGRSRRPRSAPKSISIVGPPVIRRVVLAQGQRQKKMKKKKKKKKKYMAMAKDIKENASRSSDGISILGRPPWVPLGSFELRSRQNEDSLSVLEQYDEEGQHNATKTAYVPPANFVASLRKRPTMRQQFRSKSPLRASERHRSQSKQRSRRVWLPPGPSDCPPSPLSRRSRSASPSRRDPTRSRSPSPPHRSKDETKRPRPFSIQKEEAQPPFKAPSALKIVRLESPSSSPMRFRRVQEGHQTQNMVHKAKSMPGTSSSASSSSRSSSSSSRSSSSSSRSSSSSSSSSSSPSSATAAQTASIRAQKELKLKKAKSLISLAKLKTESIRLIFNEFDTDGDGHIDEKELKRLVKVIPNRMKINISGGDFKKGDVSRVMKAFDADGNGLIEQKEFVDWITGGLQLSKDERAEFASHTALSAKLNDLLLAVDKYIAFRAGRQRFLARQAAKKAEAERAKKEKEDAKQKKKLARKTKSALHLITGGLFGSANKLKESIPTAHSGASKTTTSSPTCVDEKQVSTNAQNTTMKHNNNRQKKTAGLQPHVYGAATNDVAAGEATAASLSNQIYFDYRALNFGHTVIRTSTRKRIALVNDSTYQIAVVLSMPTGKGFQIIFPGVNSPAMKKEAFQRFPIEPKSQLVIPVRFRPLLLGTSVCTVVGKVTVEGRKHMRVVCALEGRGT
jgi:Ca2+-binding EF-hand superfamily protein